MKHPIPKLLTEEGISIEVKLLQPEKHHSPKLVTEEGILTDVKFERHQNSLPLSWLQDTSSYHWAI